VLRKFAHILSKLSRVIPEMLDDAYKESISFVFHSPSPNNMQFFKLASLIAISVGLVTGLSFSHLHPNESKVLTRLSM